MDITDGITKLVSDYFKKFANVHRGTTSTASPIFTGFLKLLGFDTTKMGAIAINGLIFLAQLLSSSLMHKPISKTPESKYAEDISSENPFDWILENAEIAKIMSYVTAPNLYEHVIEYVKERSLDEESICLQLLICKIAPFVWGMQRALNSSTNWPAGNEKYVLYRYIPERNEIWEQSKKCEKKIQFCT